jgi:hydrogenase maturation protein HypF
VFQNDLLFDRLAAELSRISDIRILSNVNVPVNDGGISLGQAAIAALADCQR